jgi:hypothetical protein
MPLPSGDKNTISSPNNFTKYLNLLLKLGKKE